MTDDQNFPLDDPNDAPEKDDEYSIPRMSSFWADALRDLPRDEGSSTEERLRRRADAIRAAERRKEKDAWIVDDPAIELPAFEPLAAPETIDLVPRTSLPTPKAIELPEFAPEETSSQETAPEAPVEEDGVEENVPEPEGKGVGDVLTALLERWSKRKRAVDGVGNDERSRSIAREFASEHAATLYSVAAECLLCPPCGFYAAWLMKQAYLAAAEEEPADAEEFEARALSVLNLGKLAIVVVFLVVAVTLVGLTLTNPE